MIPSGLTSSVIHRTSFGDGYVRVRDSRLISAVAQFLYDEAALLDEWRLDEWLTLFHLEAANYLIPSHEDLSDDPATTLHLVNDSITTLAGRVGRLKSKHAHAESPRSRTRRQITNVRVWQGPDDLLCRSVFDVTRVPGSSPFLRKERGDERAQAVGPNRRPGPAPSDRRAAGLHRVAKSPRVGPARNAGEVRAG
jgi:hypothetical protein